jgi:hypothetical protein
MGYDKSPLIKQAEDNYIPRHTSTTKPEDADNGETTPCDKCGHAIRMGEHPFCPHGFGSVMTISDSIPGGIEIKHGLCNLDGTPRRYDSHSEIAAEAKKRGLSNVVVHVPKPGSDKSPHTTRHV